MSAAAVGAAGEERGEEMRRRADALAGGGREMVGAAGAEGPRLCPIPGRVYTELDALRSLTGASAELLAAGGALGAEGAVYLAVTGEEDQLEAVRALARMLRDEPPTRL